MLLKKSLSTGDQNFSRPLMRFSDKNVGTSSPSLVKKLTGGFDIGLGAVLIGEYSLASFLSKKSREGISGLFQQYRPNSEAECASQQTRNIEPLSSGDALAVQPLPF
jgi:hypothetical protein